MRHGIGRQIIKVHDDIEKNYCIIEGNWENN